VSGRLDKILEVMENIRLLI